MKLIISRMSRETFFGRPPAGETRREQPLGRSTSPTGLKRVSFGWEDGKTFFPFRSAFATDVYCELPVQAPGSCRDACEGHLLVAAWVTKDLVPVAVFQI